MHHYPFHIGDYVAHTRHLSPIEDLAYRRLLDAYYLHEGPLTEEVAVIARRIGLRDHVPEVETVLNEFFEASPDGWRHGRCDEEIARYKAMVDGGRNGAAKRWAKGGDAPPIARAKGGHKGGDKGGQTPPNGNQNQNQNQEPSPPIPPKGPDLFDEFWSAYPRKVGKDAAQRAFDKRKPDRPLLDRMLAAVAKQKASPDWTKDDGQFIPHPATWLNQGRWQDEGMPQRPLTWGEQEMLKRYPNGAPPGYVPMAGPAGG